MEHYLLKFMLLGQLQYTVKFCTSLALTRQKGINSLNNYFYNGFHNMKKTKVAKAIAFAIAGTALTAGSVSTASAASTTMYNLYRANSAGFTGGIANPCSPCSNSASTPNGILNDQGGWTDGWVWDPNPVVDYNEGIGLTAATAAPNRPGWVGIGGSSTPTLTTPFGYSGGGTLNWALEFTGGTNTRTISNADSISTYNVSADIDTAKGAWSDNALGSAAGWRHDLDIGLFRSKVGGLVTMTLSGVNQSGTNFGFTIFKGMDTSTVAYNHHGPAWNAGTNIQASAPTAASLRGGNTNLPVESIVAYSIGDPDGAGPLTPTNLNTITFYAIANQVYTIVVGGYRNGAWGDTTDGYALTVSQAPVPTCKFTPTGALTGVPSAPPLLNGVTFEIDALASGSNINNIASMTCYKTTNIDTTGMVFSPAATSGPTGSPTGTTPAWTFPNSNTLQVTARRAVTGSSGALACTVMDSSGNVCWTDPVIEQAVRVKGLPVTTQILDGGQPLSANYQYLGVKNGPLGLNALEFNVNGKKYKLTALRNNAIYYLNIGSALRSDVPNDVSMTAKGKPDSSASVFFSDGPLQLQ